SSGKPILSKSSLPNTNAVPPINNTPITENTTTYVSCVQFFGDSLFQRLSFCLSSFRFIGKIHLQRFLFNQNTDSPKIKRFLCHTRIKLPIFVYRHITWYHILEIQKCANTPYS